MISVYLRNTNTATICPITLLVLLASSARGERMENEASATAYIIHMLDKVAEVLGKPAVVRIVEFWLQKSSKSNAFDSDEPKSLPNH
jgi:hypothetical protein